MRMGIVLTRKETSEILKSAIEDSPVFVSKHEGGGFVIESEPSRLDPKEVAETILEFYGIEFAYEVETISMLPDGGISMEISIKIK